MLRVVLHICVSVGVMGHSRVASCGVIAAMVDEVSVSVWKTVGESLSDSVLDGMGVNRLSNMSVRSPAIETVSVVRVVGGVAISMSVGCKSTMVSAFMTVSGAVKVGVTVLAVAVAVSVSEDSAMDCGMQRGGNSAMDGTTVGVAHSMLEMTALVLSELVWGLLDVEVADDRGASVATEVLVLLVDSLVRPSAVLRSLMGSLPVTVLRLGVIVALNIGSVDKRLQRSVSR